jgi:hypothetical protein
MNELFIQKHQFTKVAYKRLSGNPNDWTAEIMESFYNQYPFFANAKVNITLSQKDETKGYAIGQIEIKEGAGIIVPIVIRDRELFPFDVAIIQGETIPLTNDMLQFLANNPSAFGKLVKPSEGDASQALFNTSFSQSITPTYMHETYKQASVIEKKAAPEKIVDMMLRTWGSPQIVQDLELAKHLAQIAKGGVTTTSKAGKVRASADGTGYIVSMGKKAEYAALSGPEQSAKLMLAERLKANAVVNPSLTAAQRDVPPYEQSLKTMEEQALMGGEVKAQEIFRQLKQDYSIRRAETQLYMMLCFKKWALEQGMKADVWGVPGFEKTGAIADWFFDEDVNFLNQHTGVNRRDLVKVKAQDKAKFEEFVARAKAALSQNGKIRAGMQIIAPREGGPQSLTDKTFEEAGKNVPTQPAEGVTPFSKQGDASSATFENRHNLEDAIGLPNTKYPEGNTEAEAKLKKQLGPVLQDIDHCYPEVTNALAKGASLIEKIAATVTQEQKDAFFSVLANDERIVEGFKQNQTGEPILKLAAVKPQEINFIDKVRKELPRDIHYIYKTAAHEYTGIFGNAHIADPVVITLGEEQAKQMEAIRTAPLSTFSEPIEKTAGTKFAFNANDRTFVVMADNTFLEFEPGKTPALDENGMLKFASLAEDAEPEITKNATWSVGTWFAEPFEVTRVWVDHDKEYVETWNGLEKRAYTRMQGIDAPYTEKGITYLPKDAKFIKLGERVTVPERIIDNPMYNNTVTKSTGDEYVLAGRVFSEMLQKEGSVQDYARTAWTMIQCGVRTEDIEKLASLRNGQTLELRYDLRIPQPIEKIASMMESEYTEDAETISELARNFIKEASVINETPTVDAVLSLNFVNKNNIREFAQNLPLFLETSKKLAQMLLETRVGVEIADEQALRRVMLGLAEIVGVLQGIQNVLTK